MGRRPEGTGTPTRRTWRGRPVWLVVVMVAFALYLAFRLVEGVVWVVGLL